VRRGRIGSNDAREEIGCPSGEAPERETKKGRKLG
jgi:hypothetical protein